jgi:hypothetical protein
MRTIAARASSTIAFLLCVWLLAAAVPARGDTIVGPMIITQDITTDFKAIGSLTTQDTSTPVNGVDVPFLAVPGTNWRFEISHSSPGYLPPGPGDGFKDVRIGIRGINPPDGHVNPPHGGEGANSLPLKRSGPKSVPFGVGQFLSALKRDPHPGAVGGPHSDHYNVRAVVTALPGPPNPGGGLPGPPNILTGPTEVLAAHRPSSIFSFPKYQGLGSSGNPSGSTVSYHAELRRLSFDIGAIDILDSNGGLTGGIAPIYAGDPVLGAVWTVTALEFLGTDPDGRFRFGGGTVALTDPAGNFTFEGTFDEYLIADTTQSQPLSSFGLFNELTITDVVGDASSPFLRDFSDRNMFGVGISDAEWALFRGIDFAFVTSVDLAGVTQGFSQSVFDLPATYTISANGAVPGPSSAVLLGVGTLGLLVYRSRFLGHARGVSR